MAKIDYQWNEESISNNMGNGETPQLSGRKDLQLARRFFHMLGGITIASLYWFTFTHQQAIHLLGLVACLLYVLEQVRINYSNFSNRFLPITRFFMRAEEQLKESAMIPYAFAVLLTIITFPKPLALIAIYTLAIADPLSAIIGISFGKRKVVSHKTIEGSLAFFFSTLMITLYVLYAITDTNGIILLVVSLIIALLVSIFEMLPLKLDDNLTIPIFTAIISWPICLAFGISV